MSTYYQIIDGKRYNASLSTNAQFRTRSAGDGRISEQDAQDLWQIAMSGGRITDTEEDTLHYLLETLNWTDAARDWMTQELGKEVEEIKSYYKVIDGLRYDRKILAEADARIEGKGDGRISQDDAEFLLPLISDFGNVTIIEERTLGYLMENYNWTDGAREWFLERVDPISKSSDVAAALTAIMKQEFGFERLGLAWFRDEALQQMLDYENRVTLPIALRSAISNLLNSTDDRSFGALISGYGATDTREFIEGGRLVLLPGDMASEPTYSNFPTPLNGESLAENWVFGLELFDLSDDIYWVIVPRDGQSKTYNYIGGPNVEEYWPRIQDQPFFTIEVKSCDQPYPGITVDVQDPDGKYTIAKSDANGDVKVLGPAGTYSIYASDGWSSQSKTFVWDGVGQNQTKAIVLDC